MGSISRGRSKHRPRNDERLFGGLYPFIQTADVKSAELYITDYSQSYSEFGLQQSKLWPIGTLCITIAANIADTAILGIPACFPDSIMGFNAYEGVANTKFVKYSFDILQKQCKQISQGAAQDNMSWEKLSTIEFPCPPIEVQNRIVAILCRYDDLILNYQKQIRLLEEAAQRLYKDWFVDLHFPGYENVQVVDGVPEGWEKKNIDDVYQIKYGKNLSTKEIFSVGEFPVYGANGIIGFYDKKNCDECVVLITSRGNGSGDVSMTYEKECFVTNNSFIVRPLRDYEYCGLPYIFESLRMVNFRSVRTGAAQPQLTNASIHHLNIIIPAKELIVKYCRNIEGSYEQIRNLKHQLRLLTEARNRLLPKLMSGEIAV